MTGIPNPESVSTKQARIATLAQRMPQAAIHSLSHHMDRVWLHEAYRRTRKDGAVGIDGQTAEAYAENLEQNLQSLLDRAKAGDTYRAPPVRRVHIPKGDGSETRPIGIPTFEDKVLQRAVVMLLEPLYEQDFYDFSYGFRPRRSAHDALEALNGALWPRGGWVLDVDIKSFFDTLDHEKLRNLLRQRVTDGVVGRLIGKWLRAGVLEDGVVRRSEVGSPQGGVISPLLANIYLHEVLDTWWVKEVKPRLRGEASLIRYADDFVMVFSNEEDALRVEAVLSKRFSRFGLTLHPDKTRLVYHGPPSDTDDGLQPASFDFLGFTHYWGRSRKGNWIPTRKTSKKRVARGQKAISAWLRRNRHLPMGALLDALGQKLRGHYNYYAIRSNSDAVNRFREQTQRLLFKWLRRRSQRTRMTWERFNELLARYPPLPRGRIKQPNGQLRMANL